MRGVVEGALSTQCHFGSVVPRRRRVGHGKRSSRSRARRRRASVSFQHNDQRIWNEVLHRAIGRIEASADQAPAYAASTRPLRILVVESNQATQRILQALLPGGGHRMAIINDGPAAAAMPVMDVPTATGRICELGGRASGLPIIALAANALAGDRDRYLAAGMTEHLSKPIDVPSLLAAPARASEYQAGGRRSTQGR